VGTSKGVEEELKLGSYPRKPRKSSGLQKERETDSKKGNPFGRGRREGREEKGWRKVNTNLCMQGGKEIKGGFNVKTIPN